MLPVSKSVAGTQQPIALPSLRCRPARVSGMPVWRDILLLAADSPVARFHENDRPGMPFLRPITSPPQAHLTPSRPRIRGIWPSIQPPPCPSQIGIPTLDQAFARSSGPASRATLDPDIAMDGAVSILRPETG